MKDHQVFEEHQTIAGAVMWPDERNGEWYPVAHVAVTQWENPTDKPIVIDLQASTNLIAKGKDKEGNTTYWAILPVRVTFPPHAIVALPSHVDVAIQDTFCRSGRCDKPRYCKDETHTSKEVVGGLAPQLIRRTGVAPTPHPVIAAQAVPPPPKAESRESRLARRLAGAS